MFLSSVYRNPRGEGMGEGKGVEKWASGILLGLA